MTKILFPTDFSPAAERAFLYALELTVKLNAELTLLHVYELPELGRAMRNTTMEVYELMEMESLESFKKSVNKMRVFAEEKGYDSVDFKHLMAEGETVHTITDIAEREKIDYIVMGTKGATGLKEVFLGSVASGVIDNAHCVVLSIPEDTDHKEGLNRMAYLTNYKKEEVASFSEVVNFAKKFNADIYCLHFESETEKISSGQMDKWKSSLDLKGLEVNYQIISGNDFEEALVDFYKKEKIDIVAVQPRKRNFFQKLFSRSVSKKIAHHIEIPLFTLPAK